jgi:rhamnogalacturonyl hydrolase YesR
VKTGGQASLQGSDGLWRPGLLDADAYKLPENPGSAFYVYALAYGVNAGILDREEYLPIIEKHVVAGPIPRRHGTSCATFSIRLLAE